MTKMTHTQQTIVLLFTLCLWFGDCKNQHLLGMARRMRPKPSDDLPVIDLIEPAGEMFDPGIENLDFKTLKSLLGRKYNKEYTSVTRPIEGILRPNGTLFFGYKQNKNGRPIGKGMPNFVQKLDNHDIPGKKQFKLRVNKKSKKKFRQWLWAHTYCPVVHVWKDLGVRFWPRWIREGRCYDKPGYSCSIPPGMSCRPKKPVMLTLLRWHCPRWSAKSHCSWIHIQYPIIDECECSC